MNSSFAALIAEEEVLKLISTERRRRNKTCQLDLDSCYQEMQTLLFWLANEALLFMIYLCFQFGLGRAEKVESAAAAAFTDLRQRRQQQPLEEVVPGQRRHRLARRCRQRPRGRRDPTALADYAITAANT